jgi:hypothetical protein
MNGMYSIFEGIDNKQTIIFDISLTYNNLEMTLGDGILKIT